MRRLTISLHDLAIAERNAGGPSLGPYLKEAARLLEQLAEAGVEITGSELRMCSYPEFDVHADAEVDWRTAAMLYPLLMLAWPAVAPEPDKRGFVSATLPAADFLPRVREIMGDAQQVAAILGL
jgi:hypothetical protein